MPQPDSSRHRGYPFPGSGAAPWPVDPAAPRPTGVVLGGGSAQRPQQEPEKDARAADDRDGHEQLEREQRDSQHEQPPTRRRDRDAQARARVFESWESEDGEEDDTIRWLASERFTLEDELDDTWPNGPPRYTDD